MENIPIIDFANLSTKNGRVPTRTDWTFIASELDKALSTIGFAYVINHDIDQRKISKAFETSKHFFEQSKEVKLKYLTDTTKSYHGYSEPGQEQFHPSSTFELREAYTFTDGSIKNDFNEFDLANSLIKSECKPLIKKILRTLAISLGMTDEDFFIDHSQNIDDPRIKSFSTFRTIYYPPVGDDIEVNAVRCGEHTDYGILTILFQDDIGGLEVLRTVEDKWITAIPIPGSILINTGDLLEVWSNGYFPATKHRVLIPEAEIQKKIPRQSIVYFHHPDDSVIVTPFCTKKSYNKNIYCSISARESTKKLMDKTYKY